MVEFGQALTLVREQAGLSVRAVARILGLPPSTVGDYFSGRHLPPPTQPRLLATILRACGETDPVRLRDWDQALARVRRRPGPRSPRSRPPYRGLAPFEPEDAPWYFGREDITQTLADLAARRDAGLPLVLVGPSGSGKSSLLRAGLMPRLTEGPVALLAPAVHPMADLAAAVVQSGADLGSGADLESRLGDPDSDPGLAPGLAIVVDQFEGAFAECRDEQERQRFIAALSRLARRFLVVIALRADFYDRALRYPELSAALQQRQVVLPPMSRDQVRRAITEPARLEGLSVEDGLVELMLRDLAPLSGTGDQPGPAHEAGALPLLSHALLVTWEHSRGGRLTVAGYLEGGGVTQAIARTAERVYATLDEGQQDLARRIFLRLVQVSDDALVARAPVAIADLNRGLGGAKAGELLERFVDERLISVGPEAAQMTHDALLTAWPRLRDWIEAGAESLRVRRRISQAAQAWAESGQDGEALLRGGRLAIARDWAAGLGNLDDLDVAASRFLDASITAEQARQRAERMRSRRLQRLVAGLTVLALATLLLAGYAFQQRQAEKAARNTATAARDAADSRSTAVEADQVRGLNVSLAAQLGLAAYRIASTAQARASLLESSGTPAAARLADSADLIQAVTLSPDHHLLAVAAADGTLRLWDMSRPGHPTAVGPVLTPDGGQPLYAAALSPDGKILATAGQAKSISLWNVSDPDHPVPLGRPLRGPRNTVFSLAFSPGGRLLAAGSADDHVWLWSLAQPGRPALVATLGGFSGFVQAVAFSPSGTTLAAGSADKTVRLWSIVRPGRPAALGRPLTGPRDWVLSVAFSPRGNLLAAGSRDHKVWLWPIARSGRPSGPGSPLGGPGNWVNAVAFSPDGTSLAAGSSDDTVRIWSVPSLRPTATLPQPRPVTALAWVGGTRLISGDADGTARVWTLPAPVLLAGGIVNSVAYSPGGLLAVGSSGALELWDPARRTLIGQQVIKGTFVNSVGFSPGGILATGYENGLVQLWRATPAGLAVLSPPFRASVVGSAGTEAVESVAFSPHQPVLATGSDDGTVRLWSVADPARPRPLAVEDDGKTIVFTVAFSPDGRTLAAASTDDLTRLWDVARPTEPAKLGPPLGGLSSYAIGVAFSPRGHLLAVGSEDGTVHLWNLRDPARPHRVWPTLTGPSGYAYSVEFSPDGRTLAAGITDGSVWLWNVARPERPTLLATLTGPGAQVFSVAFNPGGQAIAAGSADGTVRLWDTSLRATAAAVCADAGQPLTRKEWAAYVPGLPYRPPCRVG
jgi:WD40 repeat protein